MADLGTISAIGIPTGLLTVLGYAMWQIRGKQDKETCKVNHEHLNNDMSKGDEMFKEINTTLKTHIDLLARIDERILHIAKQNGYKGN